MTGSRCGTRGFFRGRGRRGGGSGETHEVPLTSCAYGYRSVARRRDVARDTATRNWTLASTAGNDRSIQGVYVERESRLRPSSRVSRRHRFDGKDGTSGYPAAVGRVRSLCRQTSSRGLQLQIDANALEVCVDGCVTDILLTRVFVTARSRRCIRADRLGRRALSGYEAF